jgi:hypothetical protein
MELVNKRDLIHVIDKSADEMHHRIDMQRHLLTTILDQRVNEEKLGRLLQTSSPTNESRLRDAIKDTIEVLEETRKAFKSKRLQALRKKLTQVLIEAD